MPAATEPIWTRRSFLRGAATGAALLSASPVLVTAQAMPQANGLPGIPASLADFVKSYLEQMHSPGMTLATVDASGQVSTAGFGLSDVDRHLPVTPELLFQIGSISKSMCGLVLLQMHDEGKLDLHAPVMEKLPWLPLEMPFGAITAHHLLTHTAGIPNGALVFPVGSGFLRQAYAPGERFYYSNDGYQILGLLAEAIDGEAYADILRRRPLTPLGMHRTRPVIYGAIHPVQAQGHYVPQVLSAWLGTKLIPAPPIVMTNAAGCVSAPPADMGRYMSMLIARGAGPHGRIVSEAAFRLFTMPYVLSPELGPGFSYGYGIGVKTTDGRTILKHTGGMMAFASSLQVDLTAKVGAFASINAMQEFRPNPVTSFALDLLRAKATGAPPPAPEAMRNPRIISNAADYAGTYTGATGEVKVVVEGNTLFLHIHGKTVPLDSAEGDSFVAADPVWQAYSWDFARAKTVPPNGKGVVTELAYGPAWYANAAYTGPRTFAEPPSYRQYVGRYAAGELFLQDLADVYLNKGVLTLWGDALEEIGDGVFRPTEPQDSPERFEFRHVTPRGAQQVMIYGQPWQRVDTGASLRQG